MLRCMNRTLLVVGLSTLAAALTGCSNPDRTWWGGEKEKPLYERLGGEASIAAVVDDFVDRAAKNLRINFARKGTAKEWQATPENSARVRRSLTQFICANTGGPHKYTGGNMKTVHTGMKITNAEFDAAAEDLAASLDHFGVKRKEKDELMKIVASTRKDIVEM